ncbi:hypothetical protein OJ997_28660 [Solirubrobacter phytolaccae]|uniref:Nuclear transport factor 2 family protein n=1 Tax=Solirubrobacter phytolaccae TaxID=1404360 RepID=A0A9X3SC67_9ACTN|nr:hypothetical protein [Solirubrobacter phytolaccae]MDA0184311.1 hypothetical protein [Solirubrobacter phytolaccae]
MISRRWLGALAALGLAITGCGEAAAPEPDQLALKRPERPREAQPDKRAPVTGAERGVIRRWAEELSRGDVRAAAKEFSVPSEIVNLQPDPLELDTARRVEDFNDSLPCGAKLIKVTRTVSKLVVGEFELTDRPGGDCGASAGSQATFAFLIDADGHIARLIYIDTDDADAPGTALT